MHDSTHREHQDKILGFARNKLLCQRGGSTYSAQQYCAILSQRLALEIDTSLYVAGGYTVDVADQVQDQIANHMRVCVSIHRNLSSIYAVAASEPILAEAASSIMKEPGFKLVHALDNVLNAYAIDTGERGELLVAAFFTRARDLHVSGMPRSDFFPVHENRICPIFSVTDLLSHLFCDSDTLLNSMPSVCRPGFPQMKTFKDAFHDTKIHFNHMVKPIRQKLLKCSYLLTIMARGAAAYGARNQPSFDMVYPFLYQTNKLDIRKVGFIIVQVKNHSKTLNPSQDLFDGMDPGPQSCKACGLLSDDELEDFTVPIIRIVFSLGGENEFRHIENVSASGTSDSRFTSYDFWCSGIGLGVLQPVDEDGAMEQWCSLLHKMSPSELKFTDSKAPDVRRSQYPAGGDNLNFFDSWLANDMTELVL